MHDVHLRTYLSREGLLKSKNIIILMKCVLAIVQGGLEAILTFLKPTVPLCNNLSFLTAEDIWF